MPTETMADMYRIWEDPSGLWFVDPPGAEPGSETGLYEPVQTMTNRAHAEAVCAHHNRVVERVTSSIADQLREEVSGPYEAGDGTLAAAADTMEKRRSER